MNQSLSDIWSYVNRHAYPILFILFALWMCIGIFPLICYETDSQELILGCDYLYSEGWSFPPIISYKYEMQPLTIISVTALKCLVPVLACEQIYCLMTALASFIFLIGCIEFARHITKESRTKILIAAMLLPEMYAIAMYPNSAIPAAACFIWAFVNITKDRHWLAILLMCVAPLFRVDVVIVYPAILPLLLFEGKGWKKSLILSAIYGIIVIAVCILLFSLLRADVLSTIHGERGYEYWNDAISYTAVLLAIFGFYSLAYLIMLPLGTYQIFRRRAWKELFLILLPIVQLHFVYRLMGCASKHYLYIAPFVVIAGVRALSWFSELFQMSRCLRWVMMLAAIVIYTLSIKIYVQGSPWRRNDPKFNKGILASLYSTRFSSIDSSVGIGAGQCLPTQDECMLASGQLFYSWYIHSYKSELEDSRKKSKAALDTIHSADIIATWWTARNPVISMYITEGQQVKYQKEEDRFTVKNHTNNLVLWRYAWNIEVFEEFVDSVILESRNEEIFILADQPRYRYALDNNLFPEVKVKKVIEGLYKVNTEKQQ